ncbi:hypothetical protein Tco_1405330 [Tanacetum coccineum]
MLVQPTEDEDAGSKRPSSDHNLLPLILTQVKVHVKPQSWNHHLDLHLLLIFLIPFQRILVGIKEVTDQAKEIQHLKAHIKKLRSKSHTVITHKSLDEECILEAKIGRKEILEEKIDAKGVWRKRYVVLVEQGKEGKGLVSMQMHFSFDKEKDSTDRTNKGDCKKVQEDWKPVRRCEKVAEEEATNAALIQDFDDIKANLKIPSSDLKNKTFEEIQALYEKVKRFDESFTVIGSNKDERKIKELNEGVAKRYLTRREVVKEDVLLSTCKARRCSRQGYKEEKIVGHMQMLYAKRESHNQCWIVDDEHIKCLKIVTFEVPMELAGIQLLLEKVLPYLWLARFISLVMNSEEAATQIVTMEGNELILWEI